ncbi:MAG: hypothetical protein KC431_14630, partial [Myxococcales bacterium]|nr:hypothetical protein [Myxococcales bacterium]
DKLLMRSRVGFPDKPRLSKPGTPPVKPQRGRSSDFYREVMGAHEGALPRLQAVDPAMITRRELAPRVELAVNANPYNELFAVDIEFGVGTEAIPA